MRYTITERATLRRASQAGVVLADELLLPDAEFEAVKQLAATLPEADSLLTYSLYRNQEIIKLRGYVGLLELKSGLAFDIQPRVGYLPTMLRPLADPPFRFIDTGHTGTTPLPLWDVFATVFLRETTAALSRGLARAYLTCEAELPLLRGKLRLPDQLRQPRRDQLLVSYDEHTPDIAPNRLLKAALLRVQRRVRGTARQTRCRQLLALLDDVTIPADLSTAMRDVNNVTNRLMPGYVSAVQWAKWLLGGCGAGICTGAHVTTCLLFPIERVFEQYVAAGFRRVGAEVQSASAYLIDGHDGTPRFKLRPDLILRRADQTIVLDTKWKTLDADDPNGHYGIEQADLYQLFAYGKKYNATALVLIYPAHEQFRQPLPTLNYDPTLPLHVVPFDIDKPLMEEVERVLAYLS